jgi:hypothetical protein
MNAEEIINKPCLICGRRNIEHMVFSNPTMNQYQRHMVHDCATYDCVPGSDHYACVDNLEYLEWRSKDEQLGRRNA